MKEPTFEKEELDTFYDVIRRKLGTSKVLKVPYLKYPVFIGRVLRCSNC
jgi:hypothetical protein